MLGWMKHKLEFKIAGRNINNLRYAWRIPGMEEPGGLPSMGSHRVGHDWSDLAAAAEYIMQNARLDEAQAGIKITGEIPK